MANKLVDEEGYLDTAIEKAASLAKLPAGKRAHVTELRPGQGFGIMFITARQPMPSREALTPDVARRWMSELAAPTLLYRWSPGGSGEIAR